MKTTFEKQHQLGLIIVSILLLGLSACTDRVSQNDQAPSSNRTLDLQSPQIDLPVLEARTEIRLDSQATQALTMFMSGNSLYMTGRPFGFMRMEVSADPENPSLTYVAGDNLSAFSPGLPTWVLDYYGASALTVLGNFAYTSGSAGTSVIDLSQVNQPREVLRLPTPTQAGEFVRDEAYVYSALVHHPFFPSLFGFRQQDYIYNLNTGAQGLPIVSRTQYAQSNICCVTAASYFSGKIYVSLRDRMWILEPLADGTLGPPVEFRGLHPVNIQSTNDVLYIQHQPSAADPSVAQYPAGIYGFDSSGQNIIYLPIAPVRFSVNSTNSHLYANEDNQSVRVYKILWENVVTP